MEQKKVQRIIGIVVVIVLVIIVMPLLFGKNDFPIQEAANIKAPPFPDQLQNSENQKPALAAATDLNNANASQENNPSAQATPTAANAQLPEPPALSSQIEPAANSAANKQSVEVTPEMAKKINDDSQAATASPINSAKPAPAPGTIVYEPASVSSTATAVTPEVSKKPSEQTVVTSSAAPSVVTTDTSASIKQNDAPAVVKIKPAVVKVKSAHVKVNKAIQARAKTPSLNKSTSSAWVVQMGNFAVKKNAVHLANVLQAAGYKAFTHEVKTQSGNVYTRVYIGPEIKQASASQLSTEIRNKLSFQGFVVPYAKA